MAALFPTKEFNVHVNPAVTPPAVPLHRPGPTSQPPEQNNAEAPARSTVISPRLGRAILGRPYRPLAIPVRGNAEVALSANTPHSAKETPSSAMDFGNGMDVDVDLGLDMDFDVIPEEKPRVSPVPAVSDEQPATRAPEEPVAPLVDPLSAPVLDATATVKASERAVQSPATRSPAKQPSVLQPPAIQPTAIQPPTVQSPVVQSLSIQPPIIQPNKESPMPAEESLPVVHAPMDISQGLPSTTDTLQRVDDQGPVTASVNISTNTTELHDSAPLPSEIPATSQRSPTPPAFAEMPPAETSSTTADMAANEPATAKDDIETRPIIPEPAPEALDIPLDTPEQPPIASEPENLPVDEPMQVDHEEMQVEQIPLQPIDTQNHRDVVEPPALPRSPPPPSPPSSALLPQSSLPRELSPGAPSPKQVHAPSPRKVLPSPPSNSPPPLPQSSPVRAISPPAVSHTPPPMAVEAILFGEPVSGAPFSKKHPPVPDNTLPVDPPVPRGGGRLKVEVVIDQAEFENSKDGYFRRFSDEIHPQDLDPDNTLAAYGFTRFFREHLLNKKCAITSRIAQPELKRLVHEGGGTLVALRPDAPEPFDIIIVSNNLYLPLVQADAEGALGFSLGTREVWSFGPADDLEPPQWRLKRHVPNRSGMVSFCSAAIIKCPDLFLDCLRRINALPNWGAFLSAATVRALNHYIKHPGTPQTLRLKMVRTLNDAAGLFVVRYPRNTYGDVDRLVREKQQQVTRKTATMNRFVDILTEVNRHPELLTTGDLCSNLPAERISAGELKYWERDAEILQELQDHHEKIDQIYLVKRSIFAGFDRSNIRKGLGENAIAELGFPAVEAYRLEDLLRDLTRDIKLAALLLPSERVRRDQDA